MKNMNFVIKEMDKNKEIKSKNLMNIMNIKSLYIAKKIMAFIKE